jgi:hypothetical protein
MSKHEARILTVPPRLRNLLNRPGGVQKDAAVAKAQDGVESLRGTLVDSISDEILAIERIVEAANADLPVPTLTVISRHANAIYNLAGTYGYSMLKAVTTSLIDLVNLMADQNNGCPDPIIVHLRAAKLVAPGMPPLPRQDADMLLIQLRKVVSRFERHTPCDGMDCAACNPAFHRTN